MMSRKQSFQCFDAVADKPSITVGHNFALPHRSSFNLEQLEKRRCSLCSESQQDKLLTSEVSGNQSASWHQPQSPSHHHTPKRPMRPEGDPVYGSAHHHHNRHHQYYTRGHCKRIVLVKNSNLSIQKTILLHHKPLHSLGVFMDDVSELMQCLIRKLYTLDGRKVDSVQSLLQGPSVLVCVGREAFHPLLLDNIQKNSEDKLPKLILKSQSCTCNEDQGYKKNVNFGMKSKKRVPPGPFPKARENMLDDDIEKRVLVNKDGSLSMEMKVHFRLINDETLHCSTEIKKSSCTFNVSIPGQDNGYYPHCANGESCSETESLYASESDNVCINKHCQKRVEESHCQHCSTCCQEYNIWRNPAFSEQESLRHIGSTSSSARSRKIKRRQESVDSVHTTSCEEYTEQVVEKSTCIQKIVGEGDKGDHTVQYSTMSRCCSRSEVCSVSTKAKTAGYTNEKHGQNETTHAFAEEERRPVPSENSKQDQMSVQITQVSTEDERPLSVETNSSDILASLKEDEDKEEPDLSPSNSKASQSKENEEQTRNPVVSLYSFTPCKPAESPKQSLSPRTSSTASCCSVKFKTSRKLVVKETQEDVDHDKNNTPSTTPPRCQHKESTVLAIENDSFKEPINQSEDALDENDLPDTETITEAVKSDLSKTCDDFSDYDTDVSQTTEKGRSGAMSSQSNPHADLTVYSTCAEQELVNMNEPNIQNASEEENIKETSHVTIAESGPSESPEAKNKTKELADVTYEERVASSMSPKSNVSARSNRSRQSEVACKERNICELQGERAHSSASTISEQSFISELLDNGTEDQTEEVIPRALSKISSLSQISDLEVSDLREMEDQLDDRSPSIMSVQSNISEVTPVQLMRVQSAESLASALSTKTNISVQSMRSKISEGTPVDMDNGLEIERGPSGMSVRSDVSERSKTSNTLDIGPHYSDIVGKAIEDRAPSAKSNRSNRSRSNTPKILTTPPKEADDVEEKGLKRPSSVLSSESADSIQSTKSKLRDEKDDRNLQDKSGDFEDSSEEQAPSTMSPKSNTPTEMLENRMRGEQKRPISAISSKSSVSKRSEKSNFSQAAQECDHLDERPTSIMSSISVKSKKSVASIASLENEEDTGRRSQNAMSVRSQRSRSRNSEASESSRSGISEVSVPDRVDNTEPTEDLVKETESAYEETKNNRAASAMSSKSQMSSLSNMSKDQIQDRTPTPRSAKSNRSTKSKNSKMDQFQDEGEAKHQRASFLASPKSNRSVSSKKSLAVVSAGEMENQSTERTQSAMSGKSHTSKASKKDIVLDSYKEHGKANEEDTGRRSQNAMSVRSQRSRSRNSEASESSRSGISEVSVPDRVDNTEPTEDLVKETESAYEETKNNRAASAMSSKSQMSSLSNMSKDQIQDRTPTPRSAKSNCSTKSKNSKMDQFQDEGKAKHQRASFLASPKSNRSVSSKKSLAVVSAGEMENQSTERTQSAMSGKSHTSKASKKDIVSDSYKEHGKANEEDLVRRSPSAVSDKSNTSVMQTEDGRAKSPLATKTIDSDMSNKTECTHKNSSPPIADNEVANNKCVKKKSMKPSSCSVSSRSAHSDFGSSKSAVTDRPKSNTSNAMLHLEFNGHKSNVNGKCNSVCEWPKSNLLTDGCNTKEISRPHSADVFITSTDLLRRKSEKHVISLGVSNHQSSNENGQKFNTTRDLNVCSGTCNGSLVATDCSRNINDNQSEKNSNSCRNSSSSLAPVEDNNTELVPSILPSSSPTEVVNEWLNKIPLDSVLYDDEFQNNCEEEEPLVMQNERGNEGEGDTDDTVLRPQYEQRGFNNNKSNVGDLKPTANHLSTEGNIQPCAIPDVPSVQLMRILLSPKLDRCNSLPEISPVYGRKLSKSAKGFLDSLVNLRLLDFDPNDVNGKAEKYKDLMNMLQSLWLLESNNEEFNVKASSEVDINNTFQSSGKTSVNESTVAPESQTNIEGKVHEILTKVHEIEQTEKAFKKIDTKSDPATPDIACRVRWTPDNETEENVQNSNIHSPGTEFISNKSSGTDNNDNQNLTDREEDTNSESLSSEQTAQLTEKVSQDPDPVWLLNLLTTIEKQFMTHYVTAMAEFKVRWNLNDNEQLDAMICELRDEVHKRIQASINNELRTIQTHAGRPRPPKETRSRESTIFTEKRHRRLKVNPNQSIDPAPKSNADSTAILMTDFNNQQNDEYCPCDSCMIKKASPRSVLALPVENSAPKMTDFDLRKILHLKIKAPSNSKEMVTETEHSEQHTQVGNLPENVLLESCKKERTQELYEELHAESIEQKQHELDSLNDKGVEKEYFQTAVGREPHGVMRGSSSSSLKENASDTQLSESELKNEQPVEESNNISMDLEQESPITGGQLRDHLELRNALVGPEDMETGATITGDDVCDELDEGKQSVEEETVREDTAIEAGVVTEQVAEGESTEGKETEAETSDGDPEDETILDKNESMTERSCEVNEDVEGVVSESELEEREEIPEDEKEKHEDGETISKNMPTEPDIAAEEESVEAAEKEIATLAKEERKIEINEDEKEAEHKSNGITHLENDTDEEDDIAEDQKSEDTVSATESAEEDVSIKEISKESGGDISFDEEKICEPAEPGDISEQESVKGANLMNHESAKEEETDTDELDDEEKTTKDETIEDEKLADSEVAEYSYDTDSCQVKTPEVGETDNNVTTEDGETTGGKVVDVGETSEDEEDICYESPEDAETSKAQRAEDTSDDDTATGGETPKATTTEDGEASDDDDDNDETADDGKIDTAEDRDTDNNEISETEEMLCNQTVIGEITDIVKTKEYEETHDRTSEDRVVGADDEETAKATEENGNGNEDDDDDDDNVDDDDDDDERAEEIESSKTEGAEEIVNNEGDEDTLKQSVGDEMNVENVQKAEDGQTVNGKTTDAKLNDDTVEDIQMDLSQNEDDEKANDETDNGETADDRTEDEETSNDNTADDEKAEEEKPPESDMEEVNETEAETAEDGEQEDTGTADGQTGDDEVTDDEAENEENEVAAEGKRTEDEETADNRTTEDGGTADEELSESEIAQNGGIAKGTIEEHVQTDDSGSLENGETAGEVNGERHNRTIRSFNCTVKLYSGSEDGADADGEDSETEVHNKDGRVKTEEDN